MNREYRLSYIWALILVIALAVPKIYAQNERELQNLTEKELDGTAKAQALGGAVSAVGADATAVSKNPAGLGLFTRNILAGTFSLGKSSSSSLWGVDAKTHSSASVSIGGIDNVFYVMNLASFMRKYSNRLNFSFSYNKEKDFKRAYSMNAANMPVSIADYAARTALNINADDLYNTDKYSAYDAGINWFPILAYNAGFIEEMKDNPGLYRSTFIYQHGRPTSAIPANPAESSLRVSERGSSSAFDFSVGYSLSDYVYLGATLRTYSMHYRKSSSYIETFDDKGYYQKEGLGNGKQEDFLEVRNELLTSGTGLSAVFGLLVNLGDYGRIGVSYLTPQFFALKDDFSATAASYNWDLDKFHDDKGNLVEGQAYVSHSAPDATLEYKLIRPGVLTVGAMMRLGSLGMLSYDFDYTNSAHTRMRMDEASNLEVNDFIKDQYGATFSHKFGIEFKPINRLALRAGAAFYSNPIKSKTILTDNADPIAEDLGSSGTITDIVVTKGLNKYYTGGIGFAFTPQLTVDLAYVYNARSLNTYPFTSSIYTVDDKNIDLPSKGAQTSLKKHKVLLGLTYRF